MYFEAFRSEASPLPPQLTFTVEALVSQLLVSADQQFLTQALQTRTLAQHLWEELDFLGQVPKTYMPEVRNYLIDHEKRLGEVVASLLDAPEDQMLRERLSAPLTAPTT